MEAAPSQLTPAPVAAPPSGPASPLRLIWSALWFQEAAFTEVRDSPNPLARGAIIALIISVVAGLAAALGLGFDRLTSPSLPAVQQVVLDGLQEMTWYRQMAAAPDGADFEQGFLQTYDAWWQVAPALLGAPTVPNAVGAVCVTPILGVLGWLIGGTLVHLSARALGGKGELAPTLGVLALAAAPRLLSLLTILPGLEVAGFVGWWSLALYYWAVRNAHRLPWHRNLLAVLLPYVVWVVLAVLALVVAAALAGALAGQG